MAWVALAFHPKALLAVLAAYLAVFAGVGMGVYLAVTVDQRFGVEAGIALVVLLGLPASAAAAGQCAAAASGRRLPPYLTALRRSLLPTAASALFLAVPAYLLLRIFGMSAVSALDSAARGVTPFAALTPRDLLLAFCALLVLPLASGFAPPLLLSPDAGLLTGVRRALQTLRSPRRSGRWIATVLLTCGLNALVAEAAGIFAPLPVIGFVLMTAVSVAQTALTALALLASWQALGETSKSF